MVPTLFRFVRHAEAKPAINKSFEADMERPLTEEGVAMAIDRQHLYVADYDLAIAGEAERLQATAGLIADVPRSHVIVERHVSYLDPGTEKGGIADEAYHKYGKEPFLRWLTHPGGKIVLDHNVLAWNAVRSLAQDKLGGKPGRILIATHGHWGSALAIAATNGNYHALEQIAGKVTSYCDAIDVWVDGPEFVGLKIWQ
jgi:broad specificity phosphatase PhoE